MVTGHLPECLLPDGHLPEGSFARVKIKYYILYIYVKTKTAI